MSVPRVVRAGPGDPLASAELNLELEQRWFVWDRAVSGKRRVEVHPLVYGELACGNARKRRELLDELSEIRAANMLPHGIVVRFLESHRLYGRGLSWIDVHLLASASLGKRTLHTHDHELAAAADHLGVLAKA